MDSLTPARLRQGRMRIKSRLTYRNQSGATLIEALVAILVLSLGMLGMAGLQLNALSFQKSSWAQHRISELTIDIVEKMQSNPIATNSGRYNYDTTYAVASVAALPVSGCASLTATVACTSQQIAADDLSSWLAKARQSLPGGAVSISGSMTAGFVVTAMYLDKDFRDPLTNAPATSNSCTPTPTGNAWRNCCPASAAVPAGVRCARVPFIPYVSDSLAAP